MSLPSLNGDLKIETPQINIDTSTIGMHAAIDPVTLNMSVTGNEAQPLSMMVLGDQAKPVTAAIGTTIDLLNLPHFTVESIQKLLSLRFSFPGHHQICVKVLGKEVISICESGEGQIISQPYVPNAYERCEVSCCEEDTTPFPEQPTGK